MLPGSADRRIRQWGQVATPYPSALANSRAGRARHPAAAPAAHDDVRRSPCARVIDTAVQNERHLQRVFRVVGIGIELCALAVGGLPAPDRDDLLERLFPTSPSGEGLVDIAAGKLLFDEAKWHARLLEQVEIGQRWWRSSRLSKTGSATARPVPDWRVASANRKARPLSRSVWRKPDRVACAGSPIVLAMHLPGSL